MGVIDLNLDAGESPEALADGTEEALYQLVTSVNIACGGHTGDAQSMAACVELAKKYELNVGAHPSFPDREGFGRMPQIVSHDLLVESLVDQIRSLESICESHDIKLTHIKPHGALYNLAAFDTQLAASIIEAVLKIDTPVAVMGLAGSPFLKWCEEAEIETLAEGFVDRRYNEDGTLVPRSMPNAFIVSPEDCANQAVELAKSGRVHTLCIHGDSADALETARAVRAAINMLGSQTKRDR